MCTSPPRGAVVTARWDRNDQEQPRRVRGDGQCGHRAELRRSSARMVYNSANVAGACRDHASVARANVHLQTRDGGPSFDSSEGESSACAITGETISCQVLDATILNLPEDASSDFVFLERAVVPERWQPTHDRGPASRVGGCIGRQITFFGLSPASHVLSAPCLVPVKRVPSFVSPPAVHVMYEYGSRVAAPHRKAGCPCCRD